MAKLRFTNRWGMRLSERAILPGVYAREQGGFFVRARVVDPTTKREVLLQKVLEMKHPEEARLWLKSECERVRAGIELVKPERMRFAQLALLVFQEKRDLGEISTPNSEAKWLTHLRHIFGLKDDDKTLDTEISGLSELWCDEITDRHIERWRDSWVLRVRKNEYAPSYLNDIFGTLRVICRAMKKKLRLREDPCEGVRRFSTKTQEPTYTDEQPNALDYDEFMELIEWVRVHYPQHLACVLVGFVLGARPSQLYALKRKGPEADIDWEAGTIVLRRSRQQAKGVEGKSGVIINRQKSRNPRKLPQQKIAMPASLMSILRWHVDKQLGSTEQELSDLLFPAENGKPRFTSALDRVFRRAVKSLGWKKIISPRAMRRTCNDIMRMSGQVSDVVLMSITGHLTHDMRHKYSTARGNEQKAAIEGSFGQLDNILSLEAFKKRAGVA
jgi:integrase